MGVYPKQYNKKSFIDFLNKNNVNSNIISKFDTLPEKINKNGNVYSIFIHSVWYSIGNTFYNFEINYYCESKIEFLFSSKVFTDVELSVNNIICDIEKLNQK